MENDKSKKRPPVNEFVASNKLTQAWQNLFAFDRTANQWMVYSVDTGLWEPIGLDHVHYYVAAQMAEGGDYVSYSKAVNITRLMRATMEESFNELDRLTLPLQGSLLDLKTMRQRLYSSADHITWQLPYAYNPAATCPTIDDWLLEVTGEDDDMVNILVAFARGVIMRRFDLQVFLSLYGQGGTGKSTYINLLQALVGTRNVVQTNLKDLENKFESHRFYGKRLVVIPDQTSYEGPTQVLQNLVSHDAIRFERKGVDAADDFRFDGMVIMASNQRLEFKDRTSGIGRRQITIPFEVRPKAVKRLIEIDHTGVRGLFKAELPGFLNRILAMTDEQMMHYLQPYGAASEKIARVQLANLVDVDTAAGWIEEYMVSDFGNRARVREAQREGSFEELQEVNKERLYPHYVKFCTSQGRRPLGAGKFAARLVEICIAELHRNDVNKERDMDGVYITNVRLRTDYDYNVPSFILGEKLH